MLLGRSKLLHHSVWSTGKLGHPCSLVTELHCSRQLCSVLVWQFTPSYRNAFFIYGTKIHEKRGSCKIATCLMKTNTHKQCQFVLTPALQ